MVNEKDKEAIIRAQTVLLQNVFTKLCNLGWRTKNAIVASEEEFLHVLAGVTTLNEEGLSKISSAVDDIIQAIRLDFTLNEPEYEDDDEDYQYIEDEE